MIIQQIPRNLQRRLGHKSFTERLGEDGHWKADCKQKHEDLNCTSCSKTRLVSKVCLKKLREMEKANRITDSAPVEYEEEVPAGGGDMGRVSPGPKTHFSHDIFQTETASKQTHTEVEIRRAKTSSPGLELSRVSATISTGMDHGKRLSVTMLLDSGSSDNVLSLKAANKAGLNIKKTNNASLVDSAGAPMAVSGQCLVKTRIPALSKVAYIRLLISPDLLPEEEGILGKEAPFALGLWPQNWPRNLATPPIPRASADIPSPDVSYVTTEGSTISSTDAFTLRDKFHRVIKTTPGANQQQE
jgi:hypothetical protein